MGGGFRNLALDALFPRFCLSCTREGQIFCSACLDAWRPVPELPACPFCRTVGTNRTCDACAPKTHLDGCLSYLPYGNAVVRGVISAWKYDGDRSVEPVLQTWLRQSQEQMRPPMESFTVASVPVHAARKRMRGFDQAHVLAEWVAELFSAPAEELLVRTKKTKPQAKMEHEKRKLGTLDGIFAVHPRVVRLPSHVLLCDDVFTSGATMDAAAACLKRNGVEVVWGMSIGRG